MREADYSQGYRHRNAYAAGVTALLRAHADQKQFERYVPATKTQSGEYYTSRVEISAWVYGFHMDCTDLDRKAENGVIENAKVLFPKLRATVNRKTTLRPRYVEFIF